MCYTIVVIKIDIKIQFKCITKREGLAMTRREKEVLNEMKENAYRNYFELRNTDDEDLKNGPHYERLLDKYLSIACEYVDLFQKLEAGA